MKGGHFSPRASFTISDFCLGTKWKILLFIPITILLSSLKHCSVLTVTWEVFGDGLVVVSSLLMGRSQNSTSIREYPLAQVQMQGGPSGHSFPSLGTVNCFANLYHLALFSLCQSIWIFPFLPHQIHIWTHHFVALFTCVIKPVYAFMVFVVPLFLRSTPAVAPFANICLHFCL